MSHLITFLPPHRKRADARNWMENRRHPRQSAVPYASVIHYMYIMLTYGIVESLTQGVAVAGNFKV